MSLALLPIILLIAIIYLFKKGIISNIFNKVVAVIVIILIVFGVKAYTTHIMNNRNNIFNVAFNYYDKEIVKQAQKLYQTKNLINYYETNNEFALNIDGKWYLLSQIGYKKENNKTYIKVDNKEYEITNKNLIKFLEEVH